jgi:hypothetical protein
LENLRFASCTVHFSLCVSFCGSLVKFHLDFGFQCWTCSLPLPISLIAESPSLDFFTRNFPIVSSASIECTCQRSSCSFLPAPLDSGRRPVFFPSTRFSPEGLREVALLQAQVLAQRVQQPLPQHLFSSPANSFITPLYSLSSHQVLIFLKSSCV